MKVEEEPIDFGGRLIGGGHAPFIIAEVSGNHGGSLDRALDIVQAAADAGASAIKLQTYTADTMTINVDRPDFRITEPSSLWSGRTLFDLYTEASTPWEWHEPLFEKARSLDMIAFSSAFDETAVEFLESLDVPGYKVASFENTDLALIDRIARTGKPLIVSTGLSTLAEIDEAVETARKAGCKQLMLLKCTSSYPADPADSNLAGIETLCRAFGCHVGLSDHTKGIGVAAAAVALGATAIEKHITLRSDDDSVDAEFSLPADQFEDLVRECNAAFKAVGRVTFGAQAAEETSRRFRRSLYFVKSLRAGEVIDEASIRAIRPGFGLPPKYRDRFIGRSVQRDVLPGDRVDWEVLGTEAA